MTTSRRHGVYDPLAPRLGLFIGDEASVPYDFIDLLTAIAPRPALLYTPTRDRDATYSDVAACVAEAKKMWARHGAAAALTSMQPDDYTRISPASAKALVEWALLAASA